MKASADFFKRIIMKKNTFTENHTAATSAIAVVIWFVTLFLLSVMTSCKSGNPNIVEIVKTDTLHVYHTDTLRVVHNDTIYSVKVQTVHDSIIKTTIITKVVNEEGEVVHSEKETNSETFHNSDTNSRLIQHTVDSIVKAKMDSINHASYNEKPVVVEVETPTPWYKKAWQNIKDNFAVIGLCALIAFLWGIFGDAIVKWIHRLIH